MKMRRSSIFKLGVGLLLILLGAGTVQAGFVWCYERDGCVNVEFGQVCGAIPLFDSALRSGSTVDSHDGECESCLDTQIFTAEHGSDYGYHLATLIDQAAALSPIVCPQILTYCPKSRISSTPDDNDPTLFIVQSTVLLI